MLDFDVCFSLTKKYKSPKREEIKTVIGSKSKSTRVQMPEIIATDNVRMNIKGFTSREIVIE